MLAMMPLRQDNTRPDVFNTDMVDASEAYIASWLAIFASPQCWMQRAYVRKVRAARIMLAMLARDAEAIQPINGQYL